MKCLDEGTLRAYLDSELPEARMGRAAGHLESCAACREGLGRLEARAARVDAWLDALAPEDLPVLNAPVPRIAAKAGGLRRGWAAVALGGALAASVALFLAHAPAAKKETHVQTPQSPLADARAPVGLAGPAVHRSAAAGKRLPARRQKAQPPRNDFTAFDDADPMQIGMVVRVMLPVSDPSLTGAHEIAADLVIGEDGRPRAFRFVQ